MNKSALKLSYYEWLLEKFIPYYCEVSKERKILEGYEMLCIYICPHLNAYKRKAEEWENVHCDRLAKNIDSILVDLQDAEIEEYGEEACHNINTISLRVGHTREDRIEWLIRLAIEAKQFDGLL